MNEKNDLMGNIESIEVEVNNTELTPLELMTLALGAIAAGSRHLKVVIPRELIARFANLADGSFEIMQDTDTGNMIVAIVSEEEKNNDAN